MTGSSGQRAVDFDFVLAGLGLAGLSLVAHLAAVGLRNQRVLLIDDGQHPVADRSWAYWSRNPGLLDARTGPSWPHIAIHADGTHIRLPLAAHHYRLMSGTALLAAVAEQTASMTALTSVKARVSEILDSPDRAIVRTDDGSEVTARWVFDSVSPTVVTPVLQLGFDGWRVHCDEAVFDPDTVTLFDFRIPQGDGARFVYVLPTSPCDALVEHTSFTPAGQALPNESAASGVLADYLQRTLQTGGYRIRGSESGVLLLGDMPNRPRAAHVVPIGMTGGLVKPSTGFAFTRIQRHSAAIARSLSEHGEPFHLPTEPRRFRLLDRIFLEAISTEPALLPTVFRAMFSANPPDRILRFLDEESTPAQEAHIIASLPAGPFLNAARRAAHLGSAGLG